MKISSPAFNNAENIPAKYTCDGQEASPPLLIEETPEGAKSLALLVEDLDAPAGLWVHWTVWNIDPKISAINENEVPVGAIQGATSNRDIGWHGPCPPSGTHRYFFRIYALDAELDLPVGASAQELRKKIETHKIDSAEMFGFYGRQS